jgi:UDP-N-acetylmuramoylalanine--D-glutamate ligase
MKGLDNLPKTSNVSLPQSISVLGLGRTGLAVAEYLGRHGVDVMASDKRTDIEPEKQKALEALGVQLSLGENIIRTNDVVVISPGIPPHHPLFKEAHEKGSEVISEPELFARVFGRPIIAITGTDGKSTVTTWTAHILQVAGIDTIAGGNLGNPLIEEADREDLQCAVLEISAFQLVTTPTLKPAITAITNLADDHLDHFDGDAQAYEEAKRHLVHLSPAGGAVVRPDDDPIVTGWSLPEGVESLDVTLDNAPENAAWVQDGVLYIRAQDGSEQPLALLHKSELPLVGSHNIRNALFASLMAARMGASVDAITHGLRSYQALPHRCVVINTINGVRFINDSKATTPNATMAALKGLDEGLVLIVGGSSKGSDYTELGQMIGKKTKAVVATGDTAQEILNSVPEGHPKLLEPDMETAIMRAYTLSNSGDTVLLSPACASFDRFNSYGHRGEVYTALVQALKEQLRA